MAKYGKPTANIISRNGQYLIKIRLKNGIWTEYTHGGHIMCMDKPKRGQLVVMPCGDMYKIAEIGTSMSVRQQLQIDAVYLEEYK